MTKRYDRETRMMTLIDSEGGLLASFDIQTGKVFDEHYQLVVKEPHRQKIMKLFFRTETEKNSLERLLASYGI